MAEAFHAGLDPSLKKRIQENFIGETTPVICSTNAFGMGIYKDNVRLVIHADIPASLENYLQEAGRAGRDRELAQQEWQGRVESIREYRIVAMVQRYKTDIGKTFSRHCYGDTWEVPIVGLCW